MWFRRTTSHKEEKGNCTMALRRRILFLFLALLLVARLEFARSFVPPVPFDKHAHTKASSAALTITMTKRNPESSRLQMVSSPSPSQQRQPLKHHHFWVMFTAFLLALHVATVNPSPLYHGSFGGFEPLQDPSIASSSQLVSKWQVTPLGGGGFGGLGIGPGFAPMPFGGFGFGFSI